MRFWVLACLLLCSCGRKIEPFVVQTCSPEVGCFSFNLPRTAVTVGHTLVVRLTSDNADNYTWTVEEADQGRFDVPGVFVAPQTPGLVHVIARSVRSPDFFARVAIEVVPELPVPTIVVDRASVSAGVKGYKARLASTEGVDTTLWTLANGIVTSSPTATEVEFQAGSEGFVVLQVLVTNRGGDAPAPGGLLVPVVAAATSDFEIDAPVDVTAGKSRVEVWVKSAPAGFTYIWSVTQNGVTQDIASHDSRIVFSAGTQGDITVSCFAVNPSGDAAQSPVTRVIKLASPGTSIVAGSLGGIGTRDGSPVDQRLLEPNDVVLGQDGLYYFIDGAAVRVRTPDGFVRTLAGDPAFNRATAVDGPGDLARFDAPMALAGVSGALYVAENYEPSSFDEFQRLRKVELQADGSTVVSTLYDNPSFRCDATHAGYINQLVSVGNDVYALTGSSGSTTSYALFRISPAGSNVSMSLIAGSCDGVNTELRSLRQMSAVGNTLYFFDGYDVLKRMVLPSGPVEAITTNTPSFGTPRKTFTMLDATHFAYEDDNQHGQCILVWSLSSGTAQRIYGEGPTPSTCGPTGGIAELTYVRKLVAEPSGDLLVVRGDDSPRSTYEPSIIQRLTGFSTQSPSHATATLLAGHEADFLTLDSPPPASSEDVRLARGFRYFTPRSDGGLMVAHTTAGGFTSVFDMTPGGATHVISGPAYEYGSANPDGPVTYFPLIDFNVIAFDSTDRLLVGDTSGQLRELTDDGLVRTIVTLPSPINAIAIDAQADDDIYVVISDAIYRVRGEIAQQLWRSYQYGFSDSSGTNQGASRNLLRAQRRGDALYIIDEDNLALRVFDLKTNRMSTVLNASQQGKATNDIAAACERVVYNDTPCANVCLVNGDGGLGAAADGTLIIGNRSLISKVTDPLGPNCRVTTLNGDLKRGVVLGSDLKLNWVQNLSITRAGDYLVMDKYEPAIILVRTP